MFYNIIFEIKFKVYIACQPPIPHPHPPSMRNSGCPPVSFPLFGLAKATVLNPQDKF